MYDDVLPDVCVEHSDWRVAMDDDMNLFIIIICILLAPWYSVLPFLCT